MDTLDLLTRRGKKTKPFTLEITLPLVTGTPYRRHKSLTFRNDYNSGVVRGKYQRGSSVARYARTFLLKLFPLLYPRSDRLDQLSCDLEAANALRLACIDRCPLLRYTTECVPVLIPRSRIPLNCLRLLRVALEAHVRLTICQHPQLPVTSQARNKLLCDYCSQRSYRRSYLMLEAACQQTSFQDPGFPASPTTSRSFAHGKLDIAR